MANTPYAQRGAKMIQETPNRYRVEALLPVVGHGNRESFWVTIGACNRLSEAVEIETNAGTGFYWDFRLVENK
jgi:hypothetical protein